MAKISNNVEKLPKFSTGWVGHERYGRATAYSKRERELLFVKMIADVITVILFIIINYDALQQVIDVTSYGHPA